MVLPSLPPPDRVLYAEMENICIGILVPPSIFMWYWANPQAMLCLHRLKKKANYTLTPPMIIIRYILISKMSQCENMVYLRIANHCFPERLLFSLYFVTSWSQNRCQASGPHIIIPIRKGEKGQPAVAGWGSGEDTRSFLESAQQTCSCLRSARSGS